MSHNQRNWVTVWVNGQQVASGRVDDTRPGQVFVRQWGQSQVNGQWVRNTSQWWNNDQVMGQRN